MGNEWLWIPIVLAAAAAQTVRNAAQRNLVKWVGTLAATYVRFIFGLPFAIFALVAVGVSTAAPLPSPHPAFLAWISLGAIAQLAATALLIGAMERRSFVVAVAYSKTEIVQISLYSILLLAELPTVAGVCAITLASVGVVLLSVKPSAKPGTARATRLLPAAALGLASGAGFALSAVGYRAAALALNCPLPWVSGIFSLVFAQVLQTVLLGGYLAVRNRSGLAAVLVQWRASLLAGFTGTLASIGWLTAFAMRSAVDVRIVGLVEVVFSYLLSRQYFAEPVTRREISGIVLVVGGIVVISMVR
jgi:drug/metabolite transporter (DMT)-like permease